MTITSSNHNPSPVSRFATGSFLDDGTVKKSILNLGWKPRYFKIWDVTTPAAVEVVDGQAAGTALTIDVDGVLLQTTAQPALIEAFDSGTVDTWTVYETQNAAETDNSRLNKAGELFTGVRIPVGTIATGDQAHWIAIG